jgi:hypothetical protein
LKANVFFLNQCQRISLSPDADPTTKAEQHPLPPPIQRYCQERHKKNEKENQLKRHGPGQHTKDGNQDNLWFITAAVLSCRVPCSCRVSSVSRQTASLRLLLLRVLGVLRGYSPELRQGRLSETINHQPSTFHH